MQTLTYQALKINHKKQIIISDVLVVESPLQININNEAYTVVMRTPDSDIELIRGLLFAEDIYKNDPVFPSEVIKKNEGVPSIINCTIPKDMLGKGYLNKRTLLSVSSCGICGKKELKDITVVGKKLNTKDSLSIDGIYKMFAKMNSLQEAFKNSGGSHAATIFDKEKKILSIQEDIGRHNAVDKTVGDLLQKKQLKKAHYLLVSGRVSYEIVSKAFIAKIPIVVAVSACSSLAVDFAKEFGICLIGFTREQKMTVYANPSSLNLNK
jgi:FdhD protein